MKTQTKKQKLQIILLLLTLLSTYLMPITYAAEEVIFLSQEQTNSHYYIDAVYPDGIGQSAVGQTFMITDARYRLTVASFNLTIVIGDDGPTGILVARLYALDERYIPTGNPLAESEDVVIEDISAIEWEWVNFTFSAPQYVIQKNTKYGICVVCTSGDLSVLEDYVEIADYDYGWAGQYELAYWTEEDGNGNGSHWGADEGYVLQFRLYGEQMTGLSAYPLAVQTMLVILLPTVYLIGVGVIFIQDRGKVTMQNIIEACAGFLVVGVLFPYAIYFLMS